MTDGELLLPRRRDLPQRSVGREVLLRDPAAGQVHFLNPTAALIWECCDGRTPLSHCERRLRDTFEIPAATDLAADIRETLSGFRTKGLLQDGAPGS
jgi:hypothetical protein